MLRLFVPLTLVGATAHGQGAGVGQWNDRNDPNAPCPEPGQVASRNTVVCVAFAAPGSSYDVRFVPQGTTPATFLADAAALQAQGKKVLISIGSATGTTHLGGDTQCGLNIVLPGNGTHGWRLPVIASEP